MSLMKWEPFDVSDRFFDNRLPPFRRPVWDLAVDVYEEKENIVTKMSLPEVDEENIEIYFDDNILTIVGKIEEEEDVDEKDYYSKEIRRGSFSRSVRLPKSVEAKKAEATYKEGVLTVRAPIVSGAEDRTVKVKLTK